MTSSIKIFIIPRNYVVLTFTILWFFLSFQNIIICQTDERIKNGINYRIGIRNGVSQFYAKTFISNESEVRYGPNYFDPFFGPKAIDLYFKIEGRDHWSWLLELGHQEFDETFTALLNYPGFDAFSVGGNIGGAVHIGLNQQYERHISWFKIGVGLGLHGFYNYENSETTTLLTTQDPATGNSFEMEVVSTPLRRILVAVGVDGSFKVPVKRFDLGIQYRYTKGLYNFIRSYGNYTHNGNPGFYLANHFGSNSTISLVVDFKIN